MAAMPAHPHMAPPQVMLPYEELASDLENHLGRANGNIYRRKQGVPGVHDGQVMIRLKRKRFIILDYTIVPNEQDFAYAEANPHVEIPKDAGVKKCKEAECNKIGVPLKMFDSEPDEPVSLYLRSGLCFECQRNLNEKRRVDRKRIKNADGTTTTLSAAGPSLIYALAPSKKKFKLNEEIIQLNSDAIIVNGAVEGTKHFGQGYGFQEIGLDMHHCVQEAVHATNALLNTVACHPGAGGTAAVATGNIDAMYDKAFLAMNRSIFLLSQWKASWDVAVAAANDSLADAVASAAAVAAASVATVENGTSPPVAAHTTSLAAPSAPIGSGSSAYAHYHAADGHNMVSLLLAADKDKQDEKVDDYHHHLHDSETDAAVAEAAAAVVDAGHDDAEGDHHGMQVDDIVRDMVAAAAAAAGGDSEEDHHHVAHHQHHDQGQEVMQHNVAGQADDDVVEL